MDFRPTVDLARCPLIDSFYLPSGRGGSHQVTRRRRLRRLSRDTTLHYTTLGTVVSLVSVTGCSGRVGTAFHSVLCSWAPVSFIRFVPRLLFVSVVEEGKGMEAGGRGGGEN